MDPLDLKETWVLEENQDLLDSRASPAHRVCLDLKAQSDLLEKKVLQGSRDSTV